MIDTTLIGNPFKIRENPFKNKESIFYYLLGIVFTSLIGFLLLKEPIVLKSLILGSLIGFLGWTFIYSLKNKGVIFTSLKKYFIFDTRRIPFIFLQIIITISIYFVWAGAKSSIWLAIGGAYFWFISGVIRIINERSSLLLEEKKENILIMFKIYAINRLSFFFIALIGVISSQTFIQEVFIFFSNLWLFLIFLFSLVYFYFVTTNLLPYILKSEKTNNSIKIIKMVSKENLSKEKL